MLKLEKERTRTLKLLPQGECPKGKMKTIGGKRQEGTGQPYLRKTSPTFGVV